jgi:hypothetical protein
VFESWETPDQYKWFPNGERFGDQVKVWRIQNTKDSSGGVVTVSYGLNDSPDAEILVTGYNHGKEPDAVAIARHASFLKWGYSAAPSQMSEAGKALFINSICYIHKFDGVQPLVRDGPSARDWAPYEARISKLFNEAEKEQDLPRVFPAEILAKYKGDSEALYRYYQDNIELVRREKFWVLDADLQALGIVSNRQTATLEKLIALLSDEAKAPAAKKLLARYTSEKFTTPQQWQEWFAKNKDRIYFSDTGGYKFAVIPEGYPAVKR